MKLLDKLKWDYVTRTSTSDMNDSDLERAYEAGFIAARDMAIRMIDEHSLRAHTFQYSQLRMSVTLELMDKARALGEEEAS